jgi:hypothetical protein
MATPASPNLNSPSAYQALPGIPGNMSIMAARAAGLVPANAQVATINGVPVSKSFANPTVTNLIAAGVLDPSLPGSALTFSQFGG